MLDLDKQLSEATKSAVVSFEWPAHVHEIFNNILMNTKEIVVGANNVDAIEQQLNSAVTKGSRTGKPHSLIMEERGAISAKYVAVSSRTAVWSLNMHPKIQATSPRLRACRLLTLTRVFSKRGFLSFVA